MGKAWDASGITFSVDLWTEVLRVLKPGGHLLACGGTRTYHRMTCAIEDAGFEIRDSLHWFYGTGFPKSLNVGEGRGTALKPAHEPIVLARKPLVGTVEVNVLKHGTGALNIDASRIAGVPRTTHIDGNIRGTEAFGGGQPVGVLTPGATGRWPANVLLDESAAAELDEQGGTLTSGALKPYKENHVNASSFQFSREKNYTSKASEGGASRFFKVVTCNESANGVESVSKGGHPHEGGSAQGPAKPEPLSGLKTPSVSMPGTLIGSKQTSGNATQTIPSSESACLLESQHERLSPKACHACGAEQNAPTDTTKTMTSPSRSSASVEGATSGSTSQNSEPGDPAYQSAFRYVAKPSRSERDAGCASLPARTGGEATDRANDSAGVENPRAGANRGGGRNVHPTVKPIALMRYLCKLITPANGVVLDPFVGSGTTGMAALLEGFRFLGVEKTAEYIPLIKARLAHALSGEK